MNVKKFLITLIVIITVVTLAESSKGMLSKIPDNFDNMKPEEIDANLLRIGIIAELDAVNLYEQLAAKTQNKDLKKLFLDISKEEKIHHGEFESLLLKVDKDLGKSLEAGKDEFKEMLKE